MLYRTIALLATGLASVVMVAWLACGWRVTVPETWTDGDTQTALLMLFLTLAGTRATMIADKRERGEG